MGVYPEPAPRADDAGRLVPEAGTDTIRWLAAREGHHSPSMRRNRARSLAGSLTRKAAAALAVGVAFAACLPQDAVAPAAEAHGRIDLTAPRLPVASRGVSPDWPGPALIEETPSTAALIRDDLERLRQESRGQESREQESPGEDAPRMEAATSALPAETADGLVIFGDKKVPRVLVETIVRAARETEVDPVYLMALADKESSFQPSVRAATSTAEGLFQFLTGTWLELVRSFGAKHGLSAEAELIERRGGTLVILGEADRRRVLALRRDPYLASLMAGEMMKRDRSRVEQRLGRDLKTTECYFAHFLGAASAGKFMELTAEKPHLPAQASFRAAAKANRSLFFRREGKKTRSLTVAEVYDRLDGMIDQRLDLYQPVAAIAERIDTRRPNDVPPAALSQLP
ncbi:transglycosylase SLT domain-containing protein [Methylobacterium nonmethylotrophicum]|uniref:Lytic transglycosylase domain-containing protein n=1 Tax=Methylobacterium nonmethylotrophicum TaxID=1141884 RepID=A0A4Z0NPF5_9HYPH|nr:transglycosylase SLT domain-containing protein [Methylobacterium nonmethylotrophicum]TGD98404.1 lytic transglycosylase domain-containing protein [Methylobacterium nonmethylotrophicum]